MQFIERWRLQVKYALLSAPVLILLSSVALCSQDVPQGDPASDASSNQDLGSDNGDPGWVRAWIRIAAKARASQPHFVASIVTTRVMLLQQYRYDMSWQQDLSGGSITSNYGSSRGLEIIPSSRLEVRIFPPSYIVHQTNTPNGI
jgi:hypothetical protein